MGIVLVKQGSVHVIERLGRFNRVIGPGLHFVNPFLEGSRNFAWKYHDGNKIQFIKGPNIPQTVISLDPPALEVHTSDQSKVFVDPDMHIVITDPERFIYRFGDAIMEMIMKRMEETIVRTCRSHKVNDLVRRPNLIEEAVRAEFAREGGLQQEAGFEVSMFIIEEVSPDKERVDFDRKRDLAEREAKAAAVKEEQNMEVERKKAELAINNKRAREEMELEVRRNKNRIEQEAERERIQLEIETERMRSEADLQKKLAEARADTIINEEKAKAAMFMAKAERAWSDAEIEAFSKAYGDRAADVLMRLEEIEAIKAFSEKTHIVPSNALPWMALRSGEGGLSAQLPVLAAMVAGADNNNE